MSLFKVGWPASLTPLGSAAPTGFAVGLQLNWAAQEGAVASRKTPKPPDSVSVYHASRNDEAARPIRTPFHRPTYDGERQRSFTQAILEASGVRSIRVATSRFSLGDSKERSCIASHSRTPGRFNPDESRLRRMGWRSCNPCSRSTSRQAVARQHPDGKNDHAH